ncbi:hypothetical protein SAMN05443245_5709 [Paraburkholderia fungorum]|uniref:Uncharacterized protein n=1 Tax=Paraburkholderia fungorum TaxID=134537 RepID=A0A1H1IV06_9BURK|nr:hypothetical protein SAMN05443245_5709 [Paraburkholderia fungorum]
MKRMIEETSLVVQHKQVFLPLIPLESLSHA